MSKLNLSNVRGSAQDTGPRVESLEAKLDDVSSQSIFENPHMWNMFLLKYFIYFFNTI